MIQNFGENFDLKLDENDFEILSAVPRIQKRKFGRDFLEPKANRTTKRLENEKSRLLLEKSGAGRSKKNKILSNFFLCIPSKARLCVLGNSKLSTNEATKCRQDSFLVLNSPFFA